jgi:hypothetical protein
MQIVTIDQADSMPSKGEGYTSTVHNYYGRVKSMHVGPQAFLVEMPDEGSTISPHFHDVDQFQVVVGGGGRMGPDAIGPVAFHYADAYTPYGPIIAGTEGLDFFTIRAQCVGGFFPMPASRNKIVGKPGRNLYGQFLTGQALPATGDSARETLAADNSDGVKVVGLRLGAHARASGEPATAGGQYYLVCSGSLVNDGREYAPRSLVRVESGEATPMLQAGPQGAEVLILQLPRPSGRPGSRLKTEADLQGASYTNT